MPEALDQQPGPVGGPAAWTAETLDSSWCRPFDPEHDAEMDSALGVFKRSSPTLDLVTMTDEIFPLRTVHAEVERLRDRLVDGPGVAAYEGFPVDLYEPEELRAIWWGLSRAIGTPVAQSFRGDVIGDVRDLGTGITGRTGRGYTSNAELNFHSDVADVAGLFFLRTAREGGISRVASSVTTHDRIAVRRRDLLDELYKPMPCSWQGNQPPGEQGWYDMPVFGRSGDEVACAYVRTNILLAHENTGSRELTELQREAVQMVADVASEPDMWVERSFSPGTMLFVNNHTVLHLRTGFTDWEESERRRHLLRVWIAPPNSRRLPDTFAGFFGDVSAGAVRGGYSSRSAEPVFHTA